MAFSGTITALVTPFKEGKLDEQGLRENIWFQIEERVDALLVLGTTGEGATLSNEEQKKVIQIAAQEKKVPVIVNVGDISTTRTIEKVKIAETLGADGLLIIAPYYNRPSQEGLALHFEKIASETSLPIILYNHPKRTGVDLSLELLIRLSKTKNIIGIKDASGSVPYAAQIRHKLPDFLLFAGDDLMSLPLLAIGASGLISVLSNLMPHKVGEMVKNQDQALYDELFPFMDATQIETNPAPIKAMMELAKLPAGKPRLPLTSLTLEHQQVLKDLILNSPLFPTAVYEPISPF
ncbi:MAG: 4-hydroxy-tetrahydrodipicolinate synthase [Chlamydiia bacterium]|nr:4-hydroxy-tetrahydrodipicolinate synthase [Chlamydiia bacterium]